MRFLKEFSVSLTREQTRDIKKLWTDHTFFYCRIFYTEETGGSNEDLVDQLIWRKLKPQQAEIFFSLLNLNFAPGPEVWKRPILSHIRTKPTNIETQLLLLLRKPNICCNWPRTSAGRIQLGIAFDWKHFSTWWNLAVCADKAWCRLSEAICEK